jgi:hypothetical protein
MAFLLTAWFCCQKNENKKKTKALFISPLLSSQRGDENETKTSGSRE